MQQQTDDGPVSLRPLTPVDPAVYVGPTEPRRVTARDVLTHALSAVVGVLILLFVPEPLFWPLMGVMVVAVAIACLVVWLRSRRIPSA